jgi:hypothetical protein
MDIDHDIVIATPVGRGTDKTINIRSGKISDTIEEIGNINR